MYNSSDFGLCIKIFCTKFFDLQIYLFLKLQRYIIQLFNFSNIRCAVAFTLAETLIVIGVIGIVSALTLPNLNSSTGEKEKVVKLKKAYQNITDAFERSEAVYGPFDEWFVNDTDSNSATKRTGERITEFVKLSKNCAQEINKGCFAGSDVLKLDGSKWSVSDDSSVVMYKVITNDGMSMGFFTTVSGSTFSSATVSIDIDGPTKGKNTRGLDIYVFKYFTDKKLFLPLCFGNSFSQLLSNLYSSGTCAQEWILKYENMDYLQLKDQEGNCKNNNKMTETNPTCK